MMACYIPNTVWNRSNNWTIQNIACFNTDKPCLDVDPTPLSNKTISHNSWYRSDAGQVIQMPLGNYTTWTAWDTAYHQYAQYDTHDGGGNFVDPGFTNPGAGDFTVASTSSPIYGTGFDYGDGIFYGLHPTSLTSDWVNTATGVNQDPVWEIGAFVFLEEGATKQKYMDNSTIRGEVR